MRRQRSRRIFGLTFGLILWTSLIGVTWFGFHTITDKFFFSNPEYTLRHLQIDTEGLLTTEEVKSITGIRTGTNIFQIDLAAAENALRELDQIATVRITRDWPDRIAVQTTKRTPIAWLSDRPDATLSADSAVLLDRTGRVMRPFRVDPEFWRLPVVYCRSVAAVEEDDILARADLDSALALLAERMKRTDSILHIRALDITRGHSIRVTTADNSLILFAPDEPVEQLEKLEPLLVHSAETGRALEFANLIPSRYTPVRFQLASAPEGGAPLPLPTR